MTEDVAVMNAMMNVIGHIFMYLAIIMIPVMISVAITVVCNWKLFTKAGIAGWKALIPYYNSYLLHEMSWGKGWMFLCLFIPLAGWVFGIIHNVKLAKAFGQSGAFAAGLVLVPIVFLPILAFGNSTYIGPQEL